MSDIWVVCEVCDGDGEDYRGVVCPACGGEGGRFI